MFFLRFFFFFVVLDWNMNTKNWILQKMQHKAFKHSMHLKCEYKCKRNGIEYVIFDFWKKIIAYAHIDWRMTLLCSSIRFYVVHSIIHSLNIKCKYLTALVIDCHLATEFSKYKAKARHCKSAEEANLVKKKISLHASEWVSEKFWNGEWEYGEKNEVEFHIQNG